MVWEAHRVDTGRESEAMLLILTSEGGGSGDGRAGVAIRRAPHGVPVVTVVTAD